MKKITIAFLSILQITLVCGFTVSRDSASPLSPSRLQGESDGFKISRSMARDDEQSPDVSRRFFARRAAAFASICTVLGSSSPAFAKARPEDAFSNLVKAREELITAAKDYMLKGDYEGMKSYLDDSATNMNQYEQNAQVLLESKRLDVESKREIGTIRRYGVGADVIIMYGGLKSELNEEPPNSGQVKLYWTRAVDSLDEVLSICRDNGF